MRFKNIIGQNNLKSKLTKEVLDKKISHAQMFLGEPGFGALPMALGFAQYLFVKTEQRKTVAAFVPHANK